MRSIISAVILTGFVFLGCDENAESPTGLDPKYYVPGRGDEGRDIYYGYGRVDALRALSDTLPPPPSGVGSETGTDASSVTAEGMSERVLPFEVYPNPASSNVNFNVPAASGVTEVKVYDISGRVVFSAPAPPNGGTITWDLTERSRLRVSPGLYLVRYDGTEGPTVKKVVVR